MRYQDMREQEDQLAVLRMRMSRLTPREREVMAMLVRGKLHKQIAHELRSTVRTVKWHRQQFDAESRSAVAGRTCDYRRSPWAVVGVSAERGTALLPAGRDQALVLKLLGRSVRLQTIAVIGPYCDSTAPCSATRPSQVQVSQKF